MITSSIYKIILFVAKIIFVAAEMIFKVVVMYSLGADVRFLVAKITSGCEHFFSDQDQFVCGQDNLCGG